MEHKCGLCAQAYPRRYRWGEIVFAYPNCKMFILPSTPCRCVDFIQSRSVCVRLRCVHVAMTIAVWPGNSYPNSKLCTALCWSQISSKILYTTHTHTLFACTFGQVENCIDANVVLVLVEASRKRPMMMLHLVPYIHFNYIRYAEMYLITLGAAAQHTSTTKHQSSIFLNRRRETTNIMWS